MYCLRTLVDSHSLGTTKKSGTMSVYNAASSAGNIIGPLLFKSSDAPTYRPGLRAVLAIFVTLAVCVLLQLGNLMFLNKLQERARVKNGKPAKIKDRSMDSKYHDADEQSDEYGVGVAEGDPEARPAHHTRIGDNAFLDLTDRKNDEFVYVY